MEKINENNYQILSVEQTNKLLDIEDADKLADVFKIFADSTRVRIIQLISIKEVCVHEISDILDISQSAVSHQLKLLRQNKLVKTRRIGKCMYYSLSDEHIFTIFENAFEHLQE